MIIEYKVACKNSKYVFFQNHDDINEFLKNKIIPKEKASEYFGVFDIFGKGASFLGTMLMGISTQLFHTSKAGVVMIAALFVLGFVTFCLQGRQAQKGAQAQSVNPAQQKLQTQNL